MKRIIITDDDDGDMLAIERMSPHADYVVVSITRRRDGETNVVIVTDQQAQIIANNFPKLDGRDPPEDQMAGVKFE